MANLYLGSRIHPAARIHPSVHLGRNCEIGENVIIQPSVDLGHIVIGENCIIHDNVRIQVATLSMGRGGKIHHHSTLTAGCIFIGDNFWMGQYSHLDGTGWLGIDDDVTIGYNCHVWTHSNRGGLPRDSLLVTEHPTELGNKVWLMGCNVVVNPGVRMAEGSVALANSVVTKNTEPNEVYGGIPARKLGRKAYGTGY